MAVRDEWLLAEDEGVSRSAGGERVLRNDGRVLQVEDRRVVFVLDGADGWRLVEDESTPLGDEVGHGESEREEERESAETHLSRLPIGTKHVCQNT